ncbi:MAG: hypothetical protein AAF497_11375, partial [Planctomycetota bacterium]
CSCLSLGFYFNRVHRIRTAANVIRKLGGHVSYKEAAKDNWYSHPLFVDFFFNVQGVAILNVALTDEHLKKIAILGRLESIVLWGCGVKDADVKALQLISPNARFRVWPTPEDVIADLPNRITSLTEQPFDSTDSISLHELLDIGAYWELSHVEALNNEPNLESKVTIFPRGWRHSRHNSGVRYQLDAEHFLAFSMNREELTAIQLDDETWSKVDDGSWAHARAFRGTPRSLATQ